MPRDTGAGKKLDRVVMLALALGYFAVDKFMLDPQRDAVHEQQVAQEARSEALVESYWDKSIAVLPFLNMSSDPEQEYFSDGISEGLLNRYFPFVFICVQRPKLRSSKEPARQHSFRHPV